MCSGSQCSPDNSVLIAMDFFGLVVRDLLSWSCVEADMLCDWLCGQRWEEMYAIWPGGSVAPFDQQSKNDTGWVRGRLMVQLTLRWRDVSSHQMLLTEWGAEMVQWGLWVARGCCLCVLNAPHAYVLANKH